MTDRPPPPARGAQEKPRSGAAQERLAAALRENLKRRKAQARARDRAEDPEPKSSTEIPDADR